MANMPFPLRPILPALLALLLLVPACRRNGPLAFGPSLTAPDTNRERLLARVVVPSLDRTFVTVDALRAKNALPFGSAELRSLVVARLSVPAEVMDLVHTGKPLGVALVAPPGTAGQPQGQPLLAAACELRAPQLAAAALTRLGSPVATHKDARQFRRPDGGTFWLATAGDAVVWSDSIEGLGEAGAHALEARQDSGSSDDLSLAAFPAAYARLEGADVTAGPGPLKQKLLADYDRSYLTQGRPAPPAERASLEAVLDFALGPFTQSNLVGFGMSLAEAQGVRASLRAVPRDGSAFATQIATPGPFVVEGSVIAGQPLVSLLALGPGPSWLRLYQDVLDKQGQAGVAGAAATAARFRALAQHLDGAITAGSRPAGATLAIESVVKLRPGASAAAALAALAALASDPGLPLLLANVYRMDTPVVKTSREGDGLRLELTMTADERPGSPAAVSRAMFGTASPAVLVKPGADRLVLVCEPGAAARASQLLAGGAPAAPSGALAEALTETRGRDGVFYVDLFGYTRVLLAAVLPPGQARMAQGMLALPGLAQLSLPVWTSYRGGQTLEAEVRVPVATLTNAAAALALFGGMTGGLPSPSPEQP
jgi:hypothetical protein